MYRKSSKVYMAPYKVLLTVCRPGRLGCSSNITTAVFDEVMDGVDGLVALATEGWGERTTNKACTYFEVEGKSGAPRTPASLQSCSSAAFQKGRASTRRLKRRLPFSPQKPTSFLHRGTRKNATLFRTRCST